MGVGQEALIDGFYEAAIDVARWPAILADAASFFQARGAQIGHMDLRDGRLSFLINHGYDYTPDHIRRYEELMGEDPRLPYLTARPFVPMHCRMVVSDDELHATRVYREVLKPAGLEYTLGVNLIEEEQSTSFFMVVRGPEMQRFGAVECEILRGLVPHLRRALRLYTRFADIDLDRLVAIETLDQMPIGTMIVRGDGTLVSANRIVRDLTARCDGLAVLGGVGRHLDTIRLHGAITAVVASARAGKAHASQALVLPRGKGDPLRLLLCRLPATHVGLALVLAPRDLVLVLVGDPDNAPEAQWEQLQDMFGLTRSEAKLLKLLLAGTPVKDAAARLELSRDSARQYLKSILAKTGTHKQSELIRKVLSSPAWIRPRS
jgi:DNA-binding CsgD family transcriptional regulator